MDFEMDRIPLQPALFCKSTEKVIEMYSFLPNLSHGRKSSKRLAFLVNHRLNNTHMENLGLFNTKHTYELCYYLVNFQEKQKSMILGVPIRYLSEKPRS